MITHASSRIGPASRDAALDWRAALVTGLITSTFSTLVAQLIAARVGRDALVDWMTVGAIPLRDLALQTEPTWPFVVAGILFHQWADITWALVFFGLLGRWTTKLGPWAILAVAVPWAVFTSSIEWLFLVPLVPFWRPLFILEQPYWLGLVVHLASSSLYPLFPWLRDRLAGPAPSPYRGFAGAGPGSPSPPRWCWRCSPSLAPWTVSCPIWALRRMRPSTRPTCGGWLRITRKASRWLASRPKRRWTLICVPWRG